MYFCEATPLYVLGRCSIEKCVLWKYDGKRLSIFIIPERHNRRRAKFIFSAETVKPEIHTLIFVSSSLNLLSVTQDYMNQKLDDRQKWIDVVVEVRGRSLFEDPIPEFTWRKLGKLRKSWVRIVGVSTEVRIGYRRNKSEKDYRLSRLARRMRWMKYACMSRLRSFWGWVIR
jgi:hypothetical protein